jgi:3-deoxy-D-manno-octulosonic-acid transferase
MGRVLIIDRMGLLSRLYRYGQIAYVGGGFNRGGIHNVLEPAVYGMPVIFGPVFQKFTEAVDMVKRGSGISVRNPSELRKVLDVLWSNPQLLREKSEDAADFVKSRSGATRAILDQLAANRLLTS